MLDFLKKQFVDVIEWLEEPGELAWRVPFTDLDRADTPEIVARYAAATAKAIEAQVFGSPWYVYRGEPFWGQDRLDFLDRALAQ